MAKFPFTKAAVFLLSSLIVLVLVSMVLLYQSLSKVEFSKKKIVSPEVKEVVKIIPTVVPLRISDVNADMDQVDSDAQEVLGGVVKDLSAVDDLDITVDIQGL